MPNPAPQDLSDAILQQLRGSPCAAAFGDTWNPTAQSGVQKFFGDYTADVDPPYLWLDEPGEVYQYLTAGPGDLKPYLADGQLVISILAPSRAQARQLGVMVAFALDDADERGLTWTAPGPVPNALRLLRLASAAFATINQPGPGVPAVFARVLTFMYQYQGAL